MTGLDVPQKTSPQAETEMDSRHFLVLGDGELSIQLRSWSWPATFSQKLIILLGQTEVSLVARTPCRREI